MTDPQIRSEQEERLELAGGPRGGRPAPVARRPGPRTRRGRFTPGHQVSPPNEGPLTDDEPDEIAQDRGTSTVTGAEQQAIHIETGDERLSDDYREPTAAAATSPDALASPRVARVLGIARLPSNCQPVCTSSPGNGPASRARRAEGAFQ